jgi:hypothetical protein
MKKIPPKKLKLHILPQAPLSESGGSAKKGEFPTLVKKGLGGFFLVIQNLSKFNFRSV